jgi:hypothetical protein
MEFERIEENGPRIGSLLNWYMLPAGRGWGLIDQQEYAFTLLDAFRSDQR